MAADLNDFATRLLDWFAQHGRHDLPWQADRDPYRIWVSEIMLQQTQVGTVIPYFERFVARFPTVLELSRAPLDDVLALWSGLGYYARARNLHRAALEVVDRHGAEIPRSLDALTALPGIGRSTAGAILALAWNEPHAILDGNVKRVLARFHAVGGWAGKSSVARKLWQLAEAQTPQERAADYTQAIMDLGATICVRRSPDCAACPVAAGCRALAEGRVDHLPEPRPKRDRPSRSVTMLLVCSADGALLLERRPPSGIWGGLLSLPEMGDGESESPAATAADRASSWCQERLGCTADVRDRLPPVNHSFTHFDLTIEPLVLQARESAESAAARVLDGDRWVWYNTAQPLPGGIAAPIAKLVETFRTTTAASAAAACSGTAAIRVSAA